MLSFADGGMYVISLIGDFSSSIASPNMAT
jgi:hypothetical protein